MKIFMVYIGENQHKALKELRKKTGLGMAEHIRRGIDMVLDYYREREPKFEDRELKEASNDG